jgi:hypothetical protein
MDSNKQGPGPWIIFKNQVSNKLGFRIFSDDSMNQEPENRRPQPSKWIRSVTRLTLPYLQAKWGC